MRPEATPQFLAALRRKHTVRVWGQILNADVPDRRFGTVPLSKDGSTVMTRANLVRRRSTVTVADPAWIPFRPSDPLAALGLEMRLWYEVSAINMQQPVSIPVITGHILTGQHDTPFTGIPVTIVDRMWRCEVDDFRGKRTVQGSVIETIKGLILESVPWATFRIHPDIAANDYSISPTVYEARTDALATLTRSIGADSPHTDAWGTVQLIPVPDIADEPAWTVDEGPDGVLIKASETWSSENAPNSVQVKGATSGGVTPQSDLIVDDDPSSPTYYGPVDGPPAKSDSSGTYYPRQLKEWSGTMGTKPQCNIAARASLLQFKGQAKTIQFGSIGNPALDDGDTILTRPRPATFGEHHLLDSWTLRHDGSGMDASSRSLTLNDAGSS